MSFSFENLNAIGHCRLKTISNDAQNNYTESQKVSLAYCKLFWYRKAKIYNVHNWIGLNFSHDFKFYPETCYDQILAQLKNRGGGGVAAAFSHQDDLKILKMKNFPLVGNC